MPPLVSLLIFTDDYRCISSSGASAALYCSTIASDSGQVFAVNNKEKNKAQKFFNKIHI